MPEGPFRPPASRPLPLRALGIQPSHRATRRSWRPRLRRSCERPALPVPRRSPPRLACLKTDCKEDYSGGGALSGHGRPASWPLGDWQRGRRPGGKQPNAELRWASQGPTDMAVSAGSREPCPAKRSRRSLETWRRCPEGRSLRSYARLAVVNPRSGTTQMLAQLLVISWPSAVCRQPRLQPNRSWR